MKTVLTLIVAIALTSCAERVPQPSASFAELAARGHSNRIEQEERQKKEAEDRRKALTPKMNAETCTGALVVYDYVRVFNPRPKKYFPDFLATMDEASRPNHRPEMSQSEWIDSVNYIKEVQLHNQCLYWEKQQIEAKSGIERLRAQEIRSAREMCFDVSERNRTFVSDCEDYYYMEQDAEYLSSIGMKDHPAARDAEIFRAKAPRSFDLLSCTGEYPFAGGRYSVDRGRINRIDLTETFHSADTAFTMNQEISLSPDRCFPMNQQFTQGAAKMAVVRKEGSLPKIISAHFPLLNHDATGKYIFQIDGAKKVKLSENDLAEVLNGMYGGCRLMNDKGQCYTIADYFQLLATESGGPGTVAKEIETLLKERIKTKR